MQYFWEVFPFQNLGYISSFKEHNTYLVYSTSEKHFFSNMISSFTESYTDISVKVSLIQHLNSY